MTTTTSSKPHELSPRHPRHSHSALHTHPCGPLIHLLSISILTPLYTIRATCTRVSRLPPPRGSGTRPHARLCPESARRAVGHWPRDKRGHEGWEAGTRVLALPNRRSPRHAGEASPGAPRAGGGRAGYAVRRPRGMGQRARWSERVGGGRAVAAGAVGR